MSISISESLHIIVSFLRLLILDRFKQSSLSFTGRVSMESLSHSLMT